MPQATAEQLDKINRFALKQLTEEDVYVFKDLMIDNCPTAYSSIIHDNLLSKFVADTNKGVALLMGHDNSKLPVGRSFNAYTVEEQANDGQMVKSVYGDFYIDLNRGTESGMTTNDIAKGIDSGTLFDTSIGFSAQSWDCSICGYDIRDWNNCSHIPGKDYQVEGDNGVYQTETCYVIAGKDGVGDLLENSLVYAGACDRASIVKTFSHNSNVREKEGSSKLNVITSFKNVPVEANIFQYYTKDGYVILSDMPEIKRELDREGEELMNLADVKQTLSKLGIEFQNADELGAKVEGLTAELQTKLTDVEGQLGAKTEELTQVNAKVEELNTELADTTAKVEELSVKNADLEKTNQELSASNEVAKQYRADLEQKAQELGIRAQGNAFNTELYNKFLSTLSVDEVKEVIKGFEAEISTRFEGTRTTEVKVVDKNTEETFTAENEQELRNKIAEESMKLAKAEGISVKEATKKLYAKYTSEGE